jgi:hypothetical protein
MAEATPIRTIKASRNILGFIATSLMAEDQLLPLAFGVGFGFGFAFDHLSPRAPSRAAWQCSRQCA